MSIDASDKASMGVRRQARNRNIRTALLTTIAARVSGVLLQAGSLPIAAINLGPAGFSIYAMLGSLLAAMTLSNLGIGQATTLHMAQALATNQLKTGRELFLASLGIVACIASGVTALAVLLILFSPLIPSVFSQHIEDLPAPIAPALLVCGVFLATQILSVFEAAQLAQQRLNRLNIAIGIGTFFAAAAVWYVANTTPDVLRIMIAVHLPVILARSINAFGVWSYIAPRLRDLAVARTHMRNVLVDGLRFVSGTTIANFLCHPFSVLAVGFYATPQSSASYAAVMNAIILASSVNNLVVTPFRAAIPEALKSGDRGWLRKAVLYMTGASLVYGILVCLILGVFGKWLFEAWYGGTIEPQHFELVGAGLYFLVISIEVTNFTYLSNTGFLKAASSAMFFKAIFSAISIITVTHFGYFSLVFWALLANNIVLSLAPLSLMTYSTTRFRIANAS